VKQQRTRSAAVRQHVLLMFIKAARQCGARRKVTESQARAAWREGKGAVK